MFKQVSGYWPTPCGHKFKMRRIFYFSLNEHTCIHIKLAVDCQVYGDLTAMSWYGYSQILVPVTEGANKSIKQLFKYSFSLFWRHS